MTVAVTKALEERRAGHRLRVDGQHGRLGRRVCGAGRAIDAVVASSGGRRRGRQARAGARRRGRVLAGRRLVRRGVRRGRELAEREGYVVVNSVNPDRLEGQKTAALEIVEELGAPPDVLALPYGGGGNTARLRARLRASRPRLPRLCPSQAAQRADTVASAIRIGEPVHAEEVAGGDRAVRRDASSRSTTRSSSPLGARSRARRASSASRRPPPASRPSRAAGRAGRAGRVRRSPATA